MHSQAARELSTPLPRDGPVANSARRSVLCWEREAAVRGRSAFSGWPGWGSSVSKVGVFTIGGEQGLEPVRDRGQAGQDSAG